RPWGRTGRCSGSARWTSPGSPLVERTRVLEAQAGHPAGAGQRHQHDLPLHARFEPHGGPGGDVEVAAPRGRAVALDAGVDRGEVEVRADLHRPVGRVADRDRDAVPAGVEGHRPLARDDLAGAARRCARHQTIGLWTVTSLVPSGKVASTCTESSISATPSSTSSLLSTFRPLDMSSLTVRPSRAPSSTCSVISATASG